MISVHASVQWDHSWIAGTAFDAIPDLILYDFGVHWFDFLASVTGERATAVLATSTHAVGQAARVPLMAQALVRLDGGQASLSFDGSVRTGARDTTVIAGTRGLLVSDGPDLGRQRVTLYTPEGIARPALDGQWFNDGFRGSMGALLLAIETGAEPLNGAAENLRSLALTFAAVRSRVKGREVAVGEARSLDA